MEILFKKESYQIIGACFEVYKDKGSGFLESVYQECLALEFAARGIPFRERPELTLEYKGQALRQTYEPDFICYDDIIVEIKAAKQLAAEHRAQMGLLINFGHYPKLEHERFVNQKGYYEPRE